MFKKNDPLIGSVMQAMNYGNMQREVEANLCEELGIHSRKVLPHEMQSEYDALLKQRLDEASIAKKANDWTRTFTNRENAAHDDGDETTLMRSAMDHTNGNESLSRKMVNHILNIKEELKGNQHKIDANKNNRIDSQDFKMLRASKGVNEASKDTSKKAPKEYGVDVERELARKPKGEYGVDTEREMAKKEQPRKAKYFEESDDMGPVHKSEGPSPKTYRHKTSGKEISSVKAPAGDQWELVKESGEMGAVAKNESPKTYRHKTSGKEINAVKAPAGDQWELVKEEQLDEISDKLKKRYVRAAKLDKAHAERQADFSSRASNNKEYNPVTREKFRQEADWLKSIAAKRAKGIAKATNEETLDELKKSTLASYIKKASHDVATRSAAVRGFSRDAEQQRKDMKPMDARRSEERAEKTFKKSWKRREGIAKAADRLASEESDPYIEAAKKMTRAERSAWVKDQIQKAKEEKARLRKSLRAKTTKPVKEETNQIDEKAPPGAKYERMVKHIKAGYAKDGLTQREKGIAYATAWKAKNKKKMSEEITLDSVLDEISHNLGFDIREQSAIDNQPVGAKLRNFFTRSNTERNQDAADRLASVGQGANRTQGTPTHLAPAVQAQAQAASRENQARDNQQMSAAYSRQQGNQVAAPSTSATTAAKMSPQGGDDSTLSVNNARATSTVPTPRTPDDSTLSVNNARTPPTPVSTTAAERRPAPSTPTPRPAAKPDTSAPGGLSQKEFGDIWKGTGATQQDVQGMIDRGKTS
jgi:predicted RNA-binding protein YlxR (DUF448 family)